MKGFQKVVEAFEKYERASKAAQQVSAKNSHEAGTEDGQGIGSPMNSLMRERARLEALFYREEARSDFYKALATLRDDM